MRVFLAGIRTETNSFVERHTTLEDFERRGYFSGAGDPDPVDESVHPGYAAFLRCARAEGHEIIMSLAAYATPGGPVTPEAYAALKARLLDDLTSRGPTDLILLDLHGAMMTSDINDCEGDLLGAIREAAGRGPVIATLIDPHATLSASMLRFSTLIHAYKEYPHTDVSLRAEELYRLAMEVRTGGFCPQYAVVPCHLLGGFPTTREPMRTFVGTMSRIEERPGILSVSLIHGFPWSDSPHNGAKLLVYADRDQAAAEDVAQQCARAFAAIADDAIEMPLCLERGIAFLYDHQGERVIVADTSDNPGGGADGDATHVLRGLMDAGIRRIGAAVFHDPASLARCLAAGEGAELMLSIGGRASRYSGEPLVVKARVAGIADHIDRGTEWGYVPATPLVRLSCSFGDIIISDKRQEALSPRLFTATGARLEDYDVLLLKSSNHFRASFAAYADHIISIGSPTAMDPDLERLGFRHLQRPIWPLDPLPVHLIVPQQNGRAELQNG